MNRRKLIICASVLVFFVALGITLYPIVANQYSTAHQSQIYTQYQQELETADSARLSAAAKRAAEYNAALYSLARQDGSFSENAITQAEVDYAEQLNLTGSGIMGYVQIPELGVKLPIYHGTAEATLDKGIGHLLGSSLPIGGESTHAVLTGHSGMASQVMFSDLSQLQIGDIFYLDILNEHLTYQVDQIKTVLPNDTTYLGITQGADYCTLVTCTPFGVNTHRLLVRGSRISGNSEGDEITVESPEAELPVSIWEQQYLNGIYWGLSLIAIVLTGALATLYVKRHRKGNGGKYER